MAKIYFVSLGCDKNTCDSEVMLALLGEKGHEITNDEYDADVAVVNTCCFIHDAKEESINTIIELGRLKEEGSLRGVVVCGCLAQRYADDIREELPEADVLVGSASFEHIAEAVECVLNGNPAAFMEDIDTPQAVHGKRMLSGIGYSSYLKIAEGCNKRCTYCVIPYVRGAYRSVPMEELINEAKVLTDKGIKELTLVAEETTLYGVDLYGEKKLPELLRRLSDIPGLLRIRLLYCYPEEITDELISAMAELKKVCHYIDMPIQHASDRILKKMGRKTNKAEITERIHAIRERIPDIVLRTTMITGFPGETQEDFEELYNFIDEMEFEHLGVFTYSAEEGTPAFSMPDQVPEDVKEARRNELMELQQEISAELLEKKVGNIYQVIIDGRLPEADNDDVENEIYVGRTYMDAPEVDGCMFVRTKIGFMTGDVCSVRVTDATEYDLYGEPEEELG